MQSLAASSTRQAMRSRSSWSMWTRSFSHRVSTPRIHPTLRRASTPSTCFRCLNTTTTAQAEAVAFRQDAPEYIPTPTKRLPQTLTEKIVQRHAVDLPEGKTILAGDYISLSPRHCMTHDNTAACISKFLTIGATQINDPHQIVFTLDHDIGNKSPANLKKYEKIEAFAKLQGNDFYPAGRGVGHQIMVENSYCLPGTMVVASDSHSPMYGGIASLGTAVVRTDAASIWATSKTWWRCPPIARVTFTGTLPKGVTGKDVIVALCTLFPLDVLNHAVEYTGSEETMTSLSIDSRLTIANMSTEWGALTGLFPIDQTLEEWLRAKADRALEDGNDSRINHDILDDIFANRLTADPDAKYAKQLYLNLDTLSPYVSGPNSVKIATPLNELSQKKIKVQRAYILSCTNGRASDFAGGAKVFKDAAAASPDGKVPKIADGVNLYIAAASTIEQAKAEAAGDWQALVEAGAEVLPPGCGTCIGLGKGLLEEGETAISASNRNFKGRLGHVNSQAYLSSPEVVAASALNGYISGPGSHQVPEGWSGVEYGFGTGPGESPEAQPEAESAEVASDESAAATILPGFPEKISGEIVFLDADNLNTDGVYPGYMTYKENVTEQEMADVCMENYDKEFRNIAKAGDIVVSGYNFGTGSSREQAATSLLAKGIPLVVSGSFGNIFSRNSINNALLGLEIPRLIERLRARYAKDTPKATRRTGWTFTWDVKRSVVEIVEDEGGKMWTEKVGELPVNVQAIIAAGGLEAWVKNEIAKTGSS